MGEFLLNRPSQKPLQNEARTLTDIIENKGFKVISVMYKASSTDIKGIGDQENGNS